MRTITQLILNNDPLRQIDLINSQLTTSQLNIENRQRNNIQLPLIVVPCELLVDVLVNLIRRWSDVRTGR